jgi:hypothetical protein
MPIYEYQAQDGTKIELIRPMADADKPVQDPDGKGRTFVRVASTFAAQGTAVAAGRGHVHQGPMCPCGKNKGGCGGGN